MSDTTHEELPPLPELPYTMLTPSDCRLLMENYARQCIATLKTENERLHKLLDDAEAVLVRQRDARTAAQSQAAAMAGLLDAVESGLSGAICPDVNGKNWFDARDAALAAWREGK